MLSPTGKKKSTSYRKNQHKCLLNYLEKEINIPVEIDNMILSYTPDHLIKEIKRIEKYSKEDKEIVFSPSPYRYQFRKIIITRSKNIIYINLSCTKKIFSYTFIWQLNQQAIQIITASLFSDTTKLHQFNVDGRIIFPTIFNQPIERIIIDATGLFTLHLNIISNTITEEKATIAYMSYHRNFDIKENPLCSYYPGQLIFFYSKKFFLKNTLNQEYNFFSQLLTFIEKAEAHYDASKDKNSYTKNSLALPPPLYKCLKNAQKLLPSPNNNFNKTIKRFISM